MTQKYGDPWNSRIESAETLLARCLMLVTRTRDILSQPVTTVGDPSSREILEKDSFQLEILIRNHFRKFPMFKP